jgi:hypothetical protein
VTLLKKWVADLINFGGNVLDWLQLVLLERFGQQFKFRLNHEILEFYILAGEGKIQFDTLFSGFFVIGSCIPCSNWKAENESFNSILSRPLPTPGMCYINSPLIEHNNEGYVIHYDILGLVYWMLSRQEEVGRTTDLDNHGRFPATSSHSFKYGYLDRPIVDEWLDILGQVILRQWPQLKLKLHKPKTLVSCDIDNPYLPHTKSLKSTTRIVLGDLLKRKSIKLAISNFRQYINILMSFYDTDPYLNAIDWIMDVNEEAGNKVAFYFITQHLSNYDGCYSMDDPVIRNLLQRIYNRGHEIGLHPSYTTYKDSDLTKQEATKLHQVLQQEDIEQYELGGRQHYLRWETPTTALNWENAGMTYDSTLSYADHPGFRCGTCFEYPMFDPIQRKALTLRQRPLVLMECSVIDDRYLGLGYSEDALTLMKKYKETCYKVGGSFTLLWHNSHFRSKYDKSFYKALIN